MSLIEKQAPHFEMETALGDGSDFGKVFLEDYKGKYLVLFFIHLISHLFARLKFKH